MPSVNLKAGVFEWQPRDFCNLTSQSEHTTPLQPATSAMAVTKGAPGVTVEVLINGQALHEYSDGDAQDNVEGPSHSSCYVEAQSGMLFEIRAHVKRGTQHLGDRFSFRVTVDGRYIDKITMFARDCKTKDDSQCNYGRELSSGMVQRYCSADLTTCKINSARAAWAFTYIT